MMDEERRMEQWRRTWFKQEQVQLERIERAGTRATQCAANGMHRRLIVAMLNRWWPGLSPEPSGLWSSTSTLILINATRRVSAESGLVRVGDCTKAEEKSWERGLRIVHWMFRIYDDLRPDELRAINRALIVEIMQENTSDMLLSRIKELTSVPLRSNPFEEPAASQ